MSENSNDFNTDNDDENIRHSLELNYGLGIKFPKVINGKINTKNFLAASQAIIKVLDKFGKVFAPIKYDMQINIEKIIIKYLANKQEYFTLQDLLLSEQASGKNTIVIDALVWLTRGLRMIQLFIDKIVKNSKAVPAKTGNEAEDLVASIKDSYKESLEPYHGWMAQQLFGLLTRMTPTKSQLMLSLANNLPNQEAITLRALENLSKGLKENLVTLRSFFNENHLGIDF